MPELERQALFAAINEVRSQFAEGLTRSWGEGPIARFDDGSRRRATRGAIEAKVVASNASNDRGLLPPSK